MDGHAGPTGSTGPECSPVARNTNIKVTPDAITDPATQFPVVYTGITAPDDLTTYLWQQVSGTPVGIPSGQSSDFLLLATNGADINGETLGFSLTVNDAVNLPVTAFFYVPVVGYGFTGGSDSRQLSRSVWAVTGSSPPMPAPIGAMSGPSGATGGRNSAQHWPPPDISVIYTDLNRVKRAAVLDGTDRYVAVSPHSVLVYGFNVYSSPPVVAMRTLVTPLGTAVVDAVHTEQDYTLVLDNAGHLYRYDAPGFIVTDNPSVTLRLSAVTSMDFSDPDLDQDVRLFCTQSFAGQRVVVISGEEGAVLLQLDTNTLAVNGVIELSLASDLLYGADEVQFVRWVGMDSLREGKVLIGTIANAQSRVTHLEISGGSPPVPNALSVVGPNGFAPGNIVVFSGLTGSASFLNGQYVPVYAATGGGFQCSFEHAPMGYTGPGLAVSQNSGDTFETLIDLAQGQIVGTWSKTKLRNQFVNTAEILFEPDTTYSGKPIPPQGLTGSSSGAGLVTLTWTQERPGTHHLVPRGVRP